MAKTIMLNEQGLRQVIKEQVRKVLKEDFGKYVSPAKEDFYNSDFTDRLIKMFPDTYFDFEVDDNGLVTVTNQETGEYYQAEGDYESRTYGTGYGSANDPYTEEEETETVYSYDGALDTIVQKIENGLPDGTDEEYIDIDTDEVGNIVGEALKYMFN